MKNKNPKIEIDPIQRALQPDSDVRVKKITSFTMAIAFAASVYFSTVEVILPLIATKQDKTPTGQVNMKIVEKEKINEIEKPPKETSRSKIKAGQGGKKAGRGKPKGNITRGVLAILATKTKSQGFNAYKVLNKSLDQDLKKVLSQVAVLSKRGETVIGDRRGTVDASFNEGVSAGGSGVGDVIESLMGNRTGRITTTAKGSLRRIKHSEVDLGSGSGSRSKSSIMRVVRRRSPGLRHIYTKYLRSQPGFAGKVTLKFTIAPSGDIIKMSIVSSTTSNKEFDRKVMAKVKMWKFEVIKSGRIAITIPFTFSE